MDKLYYENEKHNLKYNTDEINYITYKGEAYELKIIDNKKYIFVNNKEESILGSNYLRCYKRTSTDKLYLVNSLIKLAESMPKSKYYRVFDIIGFNNKNIFDLLEAELNEKHINKIISWCSKYGLPFLGEPEIKANQPTDLSSFGFTSNNEICEKYNFLRI